VTIGDGAFIGPGVGFVNDLVPKSGNASGFTMISTTIGRGASIGTNATIMGGVTIGDGALVGAGSVVTHDVPPGATVCGVPARQMAEK